MNFLSIGYTSMPSVLNDPFKKICITGIHVAYRESFRKWHATGWVEFENGATKGEQRFTGETFDDVVQQIKSFINNELTQTP